MNIYEKLSLIQDELVVGKTEYNEFGKYKYRSAEGILESAKPICHKHNTVLVVSDRIIQVGERNYVEASASLYDYEDNCIEVTASAREAEVQKGMNVAQITGSSSSYARKYALGGLFNLDDNKDPDATNKHGKDDKQKGLQSTLVQRDKILKLASEKKIDLNGVLKYYKVEVIDELDHLQAEQVIKKGESK